MRILTQRLGMMGAVLAAVVGLSLYGRAFWPEPALPDLGPVPAFVLVDETGQTVTRDDLNGSVWVADFIFTRCAGQCPIMTGQMTALARALPARTGARFVSFTVDPAHDTPERLAAYARQYDVPAGRWRLLTGASEEILRLARDGFRLGVSAEGTAVEPITHSVRFALVDRGGRIRGYYDAQDAQAMARLRRDVRRLARSRGK